MNVRDITMLLMTKIEQDERISEKETKQIECLAESILSYIETIREKTMTDEEPITLENSYNDYIKRVWTMVTENDTIQPSKKRIILYAVTQLQQALWHY